MTIARRDSRIWQIEAPDPVGDVSTFLERLRARAAGAPVVLGLDLPLGVPRAYAALIAADGARDFPGFLGRLAERPGFFEVCATLDEVSLARPFYPRRGRRGMTRSAHAAALGLANAAALSRACDRATATRPAGAPVFWTLGANQSGKAAIAAWRDMLCPATARPPRFWPFEGPLGALIAPGGITVAETYPAEVLRHLGLRLAGSKRRQSDRAAIAPALHAAIARLGGHASDSLAALIRNGFGADAAGEDRFDCTIGLLGVLNVLAGRRPDTAPDDPCIQRWEGWVLGQTDLPI